MDGKSMAFLQKQAGNAVTECFESGLTTTNLLHCADIQIQFHQAIEKSLIEAAPPAEKPQCDAGCAACCHRKVACTIPEAIGIATRLGTRSEAERQRFLAAARRLHDDTADLDDFKRIRAGLPCPLLEDGRCGVYADRPITCRSTYSSDRAACEKVHFGFEFDTPIPHYEMMMAAQGQMLLGYGRALDRLGLDGGLVELGSALLILMTEPDAVTRYLAGERVFEAAKLGRPQ
jgi:Fe-S-cluster containining protein